MEALQRLFGGSQQIKINYSLYNEAKMSKGSVNIVGNEVQTELWHKRLGHMSEKGMQILAGKQLLSEVKGTV